MYKPVIQVPGVYGFARERLTSTKVKKEAGQGNRDTNILFPIAKDNEKNMVVNEMMKQHYHKNYSSSIIKTGSVIVAFQDNHDLMSNKPWENKAEQHLRHSSVNDKKRNAEWRVSLSDNNDQDSSQRASTFINLCCNKKVICSQTSSSFLQTSKSSIQFGCEEDDLMVFFRQYESENDLKIRRHDDDILSQQHEHNKFANVCYHKDVSVEEKYGPNIKRNETSPSVSNKNNKVSDSLMPSNILDDNSSNDLLAGMTIIVPAPKRRNAHVYYVGKFLAPPTNFEHHHDNDEVLLEDSNTTMQYQEYLNGQSDLLCFLSSSQVRKKYDANCPDNTSNHNDPGHNNVVMTSLISLNYKSDENCDYCSRSSPYYDAEGCFSDFDDCLLHHHDIEEPQCIS